MALLMPVTGYRGMSTWQNHINRGTPSEEPGTDLYVPIGTPVFAPADGAIYGYGTSIVPATGRWVGINFDNGMSFRAMHFSRLVRTSGRVARGDLIAYSGASGYGEEDWSWNVAGTGGAHVHITLWPTWNHLYGYKYRGMPFTVDFMNYTGGTAGSGANDFEQGDDMGTIDDTEENYQWLARSLQRALKWDVRLKGLGGGEQGPTVFDMLGAADDSADITNVSGLVAGLKADINYIHTLSPYSLKAILEAAGSGQVTLTDSQAAAIAGRLSAAAVAGIDAALKDDFEGVIARIRAVVPGDTVAAFKAAL